MTPDPSGWRSSADYDRAETMPASDLGWEWLRRNEAYDRDYGVFIQGAADTIAMTELIGQRWGLRFPCRPACHAAGDAGLLAA